MAQRLDLDRSLNLSQDQSDFDLGLIQCWMSMVSKKEGWWILIRLSSCLESSSVSTLGGSSEVVLCFVKYFKAYFVIKVNDTRVNIMEFKSRM